MLLDMNGICKDYMQGKMSVRVLTDVSLQVEEGDYLAIMGPSGSGKTTLMNLIGCLDVPTKGSYFLDGEEIGTLSPNRLAEVRNETLGFVFQSFYLLPKMSALDNVALPLLYAGVPKKERRAKAKEALEKMGLGDRINFRPNQLSGGQCQRVAIARAIVTNPKLLLADEPTGALDSASGTQIMDIFDELNNSGVTIIMITHEQEVAARAKRICHIRDGVLSGGMPTYESQSTARKVTFAEGDTAPIPVLPETEDYVVDEGATLDQWVEDFLRHAENGEDDDLSITEEQQECIGKEIGFDTGEIPVGISGEEIDFPQEIPSLTGHEVDLFESSADVFASPEKPDVFADPDMEDVFSDVNREEFEENV